MAFTLRKLKYRPWPVTVTLVESDEAGVVSENKLVFVVHFNPLSEADIKAAFDEEVGEEKLAAGGDDAKPVERSVALILEKNSRLFARFICGWSKVQDEEGVAVPFSPAALHALIVGPDGLAVSAGLQTALNELRFGLGAAKNSQNSVEPGQAPVPAEDSTNSPATLPPLG